MPRRRIVYGIVTAAVILVGGRGLSSLYASYAWYRAMGASPLWSERTTIMLLVWTLGLGLATLAAFVNFSILRRSIGSLTLPRRLANVEFGEAVPRRYLDRFALALSAAIALLLSPALPGWTLVAAARLGLTFRESDPYFKHDLSFYITWLPLERAVYGWAMLLLVVVTAIVVGLYALTPGFRWERGSLHMTARVRRHLSILAGLLLLMTTWSYRLAAYGLLARGSGEGGAFSFVDHRWLLPGLLLLSIATVAAAVTVFFSGWTGQLRTSFIAVTVVIILSILVKQVVPFAVARVGTPATRREREVPYVATRAEFTRRAYSIPALSMESRNPGAAVEAPAETGGTDAIVEHALARDSLVYPFARGLAVVSEPQLDVAAPPLGDGMVRVANAWAHRSLALMSDSIPRRARLVSVRDVRNRVSAVAPVFAQGTALRPFFHADTLYWRLELYTSSTTYPLSSRRVIASEERGYFHHAATALVSARTGKVMLATDQARDPFADAWLNAFSHSADIRAPGILRQLTAQPWAALPTESPLTAGDSTFRAAVTRLYNSMRASLTAADLAAFGLAYDSLGMLLAPPPR